MTKIFLGCLALITLLSACGSGNDTHTATHAPIPGSAKPGFDCIRAETPPLPSEKGAVLWASPQDIPTGDNVIVLDYSEEMSQSLLLHAKNDQCTEVLRHLRTITIAPGGNPLMGFCHNILDTGDERVVVPWGAVNVDSNDPKPLDFTSCWNKFSGSAKSQSIELAVVSPQYLLDWSGRSCRQCNFSKQKNVLFEDPPAGTLMPQADVSGSNFNGASITDGTRIAPQINFTGADLTNATFVTANLKGAKFDNAVLRNTDFRKAALGGDGSTPCTSFNTTSLLTARFDVQTWALSCSGPLFSKTQVPLDITYLLLTHFGASHVDLTHAQIVATPQNWRSLSGMNLAGVNWSDISFLGVPIDLSGTNFQGATLTGANFGRAILHGANLMNVNAANASFFEADMSNDANHSGANFSNSTLTNANFVNATVSFASFSGADITGAVFSGARAIGTDFNEVKATNADFSGAHIYGNGEGFNNGRHLENTKFVGAVLAGSGGGFDFTGAWLNNASFDNVICVSCNFTGAELSQASFTGAYLPGATLASADLSGANFDRTWFFCGDLLNSACKRNASQGWDWPLILGSGEASPQPTPFQATDVNPALSGIVACPDGQPPNAPPANCQGHLLPTPDPSGPPPFPPPCSASGLGACPTKTVTLFGASQSALPLTITPTAPPTWNTLLSPSGYYVGFDDGTLQLVSNVPNVPATIVAGTPNQHCTNALSPCGDGGPASQALLGKPSSIAVGLNGSIYIADPVLHRVRRIDPSGKIATVAGSGQACRSTTAGSCGDGGLATKGKLLGPFGIWVDPRGVIFIADGSRGVRQVGVDGNLSSLAAGTSTNDVRSLTLLPTPSGGMIYASTASPDAIIQIDPVSGAVTTVVGTGTSGYNDSTGLPGTQVQVNGPMGVSIDHNGNVVFADTRNNLIRAYVPSSTYVINDLAGVIGPNGSPQGGFNGDGEYANKTLLNAPRAATATSAAQLVIADTNNHRIRMVGPVPLKLPLY